MKPTQKRTTRGYVLRGCPSKGLCHHHLCLAEAQRQMKEQQSFVVETGGGSSCALMGGSGPGEAGRSSPEAEHPV